MNEYDLFDAFGGIDNELLERSERRPVRKLPLRKALIAAAAVMALAVTAIAAPAILELLFGAEVEQTNHGTTLAALDGTMIEYNDVYQIHFHVDDIEKLPASIEEYQIPHYAEDNGWTLDGGYHYTFDFGENTNIRWVKEDEPDAWVEFEQATINRFSDWVEQEPGTNQFYIAAPQGSAITQTTISTSLGDIEGYTCQTMPSSSDSYGSTKQLHVFWRSGDYAFHTITNADMNPELLAQIIYSVGPVEDPAPYLVDNGRTGLNLIEPDPPLEEPMVLTALPDGFALIECDVESHCVRYVWTDGDGNYINLVQSTGSIIEGNLHKYTLQQIPHTMEEMTLDGTTVYFITADDHVSALWAGDGCEYGFAWDTTDPVTWEQTEAMIRSLEPVENLSEYVTE